MALFIGSGVWTAPITALYNYGVPGLLQPPHCIILVRVNIAMEYSESEFNVQIANLASWDWLKLKLKWDCTLLLVYHLAS